MSLIINDGATTPVARTFTQEAAQLGRNVPAAFFDRSPGLGPKSFLRLDALSRFGQRSNSYDTYQLHINANHWTDPGTGVLVPTGQIDGWFNLNSKGTASSEAVRKLYGMLLINALNDSTVQNSIFKITPLVA